MREYKNLVATLYLKNGKAVKSIDNLEELEDTKNLIKLYNCLLYTSPSPRDA